MPRTTEFFGEPHPAAARTATKAMTSLMITARVVTDARSARHAGPAGVTVAGRKTAVSHPHGSTEPRGALELHVHCGQKGVGSVVTNRSSTPFTRARTRGSVRNNS